MIKIFKKNVGFLKNNIDCLNKDIKKILVEQNEEDFDQIKNHKESIIEKILNKKTENDINHLSFLSTISNE